MKIDFICPVKIDDQKRLRLLTQTIQSLFESTEDENINRVILVDDVSLYPDFRNMLTSPLLFQDEKIVVHTNKQQLGVGGSKNKGVEIAKLLGQGDLIYMFDSDVYFTDGWLEKMLEAYEINSDRFPLIGGGIHPYLQSRDNEGTSLLTSHDAISGWSWLLSYETYDKFGKLADNSLGTGKSEDWEYCQRIRNAGFLVGCLKNQVIAHTGMTNTEGFPIVGYEQNKILSERIAPRAYLL